MGILLLERLENNEIKKDNYSKDYRDIKRNIIKISIGIC